ncbi:MAG TPA: VOC family protein [Solirubrobacteraceae bacterium]|nr:VOC family protein [Solirubrobacteraceae bacterium]
MRSNRSLPPAAVVPELVYEDVEAAIAWLGEAFGFSVRWQAGDHRAQMWVGDGAVVVRDPPPDVMRGDPIPGTHAAVLVRVEDARAALARALEHGATLVREIADHPYGERQCTVVDPEGHRWTFTETIADVAPEEWGGTSVDLR